jgi:hypothetical protein
MGKDFDETWGGHGGDGEGRTNGEQEVHDEKGEPKEYQHQHSQEKKGWSTESRDHPNR